MMNLATERKKWPEGERNSRELTTPGGRPQTRKHRGSRWPPAILAIVLAMALCGYCREALSAKPTNAVSAEKDVFFIIPHTHWEGAVFLTREEYLDVGLQNILRALRLLKAQPNYRFVLDQAAYVKPFLERFPDEEAAFRRFIGEGRLAIV